MRTIRPVHLVTSLLAALLLGTGIGVAATLALAAPGAPARHAELPAVSSSGLLDELPSDPVEVVAETVRLPEGFVSTHVHGGPTFNTVLDGEVEIRESEATTRYGPGDFFFEPADFPHRITAISETRIHVLRLLPPGAEATTEVPPDAVD